MDNTIYKRKTLYEFSKQTEDYKIKRKGDTEIIFCDPVTGEVLAKTTNKVIIPGSIFTMKKHFPNITPSVSLPTYNSILSLENIDNEDHFAEESICLFCIGTDGAGLESSQVKDVDYTKWMAPENIIPFRYQLDNDDISVGLRSKYFGRKVIPDQNRIAYYFKAFDTEPVMHTQRIDGTPVDDTIYTSTNLMAAESFMELRLKITKEDARDYFFATTGINDARVNSLSLLTAWKKNIDGFDYYQDIQPITKLHIPTELLVDLTKGLDIIYHIYY